MSHDRGCFRCFEDNKSDCGRDNCPYKYDKKTKPRVTPYRPVIPKCLITGCTADAEYTVNEKNYCRAHAADKALDILLNERK